MLLIKYIQKFYMVNFLTYYMFVWSNVWKYKLNSLLHFYLIYTFFNKGSMNKVNNRDTVFYIKSTTLLFTIKVKK
jgi:hypothetical protein